MLKNPKITQMFNKHCLFYYLKIMIYFIIIRKVNLNKLDAVILKAIKKNFWDLIV